MTGVAKSVAGLDDCALPVAKMEKLETPQTPCSSEACRVFLASARLRKLRRVSQLMNYDELVAGRRPGISFTERQPALIACETYHLRRHRRIDRHSVLVIDFSFDHEDLCAHWLKTGWVKPTLLNSDQCQLRNSEIKQQRRNSTWGTLSKRKLRVLRLSLRGRASGLQATMIDWREIYRAWPTLLGR